MSNRLGVAFTFGILGVALATSAQAVQVAGSSVSMGWNPASGPVSGYYVIVSRNSAPAKVESVTIETKKTITAAVGETLVVQVAAFGQDGVAGPVSPASESITFVSSTSTPPPPSGGGTTTPPPPPPPDPAPVEPAPARDFNGDGTADLVVQTGSDVRIWAMQGGSVSSEIQLPAAPTGARVVGNGDYDANGSVDLLWENSSNGALTLWRLGGGAVLGSSTLDRSSLPAGEEWHVGGSADFDGDGADDLMLFSRIKGEVEVWTFANAAVATRTRIRGHAGAWSVVAADDTDGDGMAEIVWLDELNRALELRDPGAAAPVALGSVTSGWRGRGGVDLAGDGTAELVMHNTATGAVQDWAIDDSGVLGAVNLPSASGLGRFAGHGDFNADGREDIAWSNPSTRAVTLWMSTSGMPTSLVVNRALPTGGEVVSGATASDDSTFRQRFCSADLDGDGRVNATDFTAVFRPCLNTPTAASCRVADMDSDGRVTTTDMSIFKLRFQARSCEAW